MQTFFKILVQLVEDKKLQQKGQQIKKVENLLQTWTEPKHAAHDITGRVGLELADLVGVVQKYETIQVGESGRQPEKQKTKPVQNHHRGDTAFGCFFLAERASRHVHLRWVCDVFFDENRQRHINDRDENEKKQVRENNLHILKKVE